MKLNFESQFSSPAMVWEGAVFVKLLLLRVYIGFLIHGNQESSNLLETFIVKIF